MRAFHYARRSGFDETRAIHFADSHEEEGDQARLALTPSSRSEWSSRLPRHRNTVLRTSAITTTATRAIVVMPELVVRGPSRLLHNQRALYLKRLLLFEPRVILSSVPYQLMR